MGQRERWGRGRDRKREIEGERSAFLWERKRDGETWRRAYTEFNEEREAKKRESE